MLIIKVTFNFIDHLVEDCVTLSDKLKFVDDWTSITTNLFEYITYFYFWYTKRLLQQKYFDSWIIITNILFEYIYHIIATCHIWFNQSRPYWKWTVLNTVTFKYSEHFGSKRITKFHPNNLTANELLGPGFHSQVSLRLK